MLALLPAFAALAAPGAGQPPDRLQDTGLFEPASLAPARNVIAFSPQYPLWSDGSSKRRWISLPVGTSIDASRPDAWDFPPGTRLWKEFALGRRVETRYIARLADGSWQYATYVWNEAGTEAWRAPETGLRLAGAAGSPDYLIPSTADCRACHEGAASPVLGFSALQLSPERDPLAPHADPDAGETIDLRTLAARGMLRNLPAALLVTPPRIAADDPVERAARGYLHGNCGHCHGDDTDAAVPVPIVLKQRAAQGEAAAPIEPRIAALLLQRMASRDPRIRMPPLGTQVPDTGGLTLLRHWLQPHTPQGEPR